MGYIRFLRGTRGVFGHFGFPLVARRRTSVNTSNNTCHISIIFPRALPRLSCALARAVIIIPTARHAGRYYGVILYFKITKAASFRVRARDYDSCNKPISIDTMAALRRRISTLYTEKRLSPLPSPSTLLSASENE